MPTKPFAAVRAELQIAGKQEWSYWLGRELQAALLSALKLPQELIKFRPHMNCYIEMGP